MSAPRRHRRPRLAAPVAGNAGRVAQANTAVGYFLMSGLEAVAESLSLLHTVKQGSSAGLADPTLAAKDADPDADNSNLEGQTDWLVYYVYGLTEEEAGRSGG